MNTRRRPLAAVMVGDPTPLTLANLRRLATWCDLILTEASRSHQGVPRTPLRSGWRQLLDLEPPQLRVFSTDLPAQARPGQLEAIQRNGVLPVLMREPADRPVLLVDSDELLDPEAILVRISAGLDGPLALPLVPLYGALDRVAHSIHCCWKPERARLRSECPSRPYLFPGPTLATVSMVLQQAPVKLRHRAPLENRSMTYGLHVTMADTTERVAAKLSTVRHIWDPRVLEPLHLETMLTAGVHHAGWWIAAYREPEPWLCQLAGDCQLRLAGPPRPRPHLQALRAWAEARLDPALPARLVRCGDAYVAKRSVDALDDLNALDALLCQRPMRYWGHHRVDSQPQGGLLGDSLTDRVRPQP